MKKMTFTTLALLAGTVLLAGCVTESPEEHGDRLRKASGLKEFYIETSESLWKATTGKGPTAIKVEGAELGNGLFEYQLDGVTLADYLRKLDYHAHGGAGAYTRYHDAESIRMYDEIAAVLDEVNERPAADAEPLRVVVDDAFAPVKEKEDA